MQFQGQLKTLSTGGWQINEISGLKSEQSRCHTRFRSTKKSARRFSLNSFPVKCAKHRLNLDFVHDENKKNTVNTYTDSQNSIKFWLKSPQWYTCLFKTHRLVAFTGDQLIQLGRYSGKLSIHSAKPPWHYLFIYFFVLNPFICLSVYPI